MWSHDRRRGARDVHLGARSEGRDPAVDAAVEDAGAARGVGVVGHVGERRAAALGLRLGGRDGGVPQDLEVGRVRSRVELVEVGARARPGSVDPSWSPVPA